jgi:hypothetical protein
VGTDQGDGTWASAVTATGGSGLSRIQNVTITSVTSNSMTLSYTTVDDTATYFRILYTTDGITFIPVPPPAGQSTCVLVF